MSEAAEDPSRAGLLPFEWAAVTLLATLFLMRLFWSQIYTATWVIGIILLLLMWFVGLVLAGGGVVLALQSSDQLTHRLRGAVAVPAVLLLAISFDGAVLWLGYSLNGEWRLRRNGAEYAVAIARTGGKPQAFPLLHGIPDGGVSLIYLPAESPERLPQTDMIALTGERIHHCRPLRRDWHVCAFD